jgi:hypothetical protein
MLHAHPALTHRYSTSAPRAAASASSPRSTSSFLASPISYYERSALHLLRRAEANPPVDDIHAMVEALRSQGIRPSTRLYNHLIQAYLDTLRFQRRVHRDPERHLPREVRTVEELGLKQPVEYFQAMHSVLHQMSTGGRDPPNEALVVQPDWITYLHLVMAHRLAMLGEQEDEQQVAEGDASEHLASLLALYEDMLQSIRHPPIVLLDAFLQSIARMEPKPDVAWQLYASILRKGEVNAEGGRNPQPVEWPSVRPSARTFEIMIEFNARHLQVDACLNAYALMVKLIRDQEKNQAFAEGRRQLEEERKERERIYDAETLKFLEVDSSSQEDPSAPVFYEAPRPTGLMFRCMMQMILLSEARGEASSYLPVVQTLFIDMVQLNVPVSLAHFTLLLRSQIRMAQLEMQNRGEKADQLPEASAAVDPLSSSLSSSSSSSSSPSSAASSISSTISHLVHQYPELRQIALQARSSSPDARFRNLAMNALVELDDVEKFREAYELLRPMTSTAAAPFWSYYRRPLSSEPSSSSPPPSIEGSGPRIWQRWTWEEHLEWLRQARSRSMILEILEGATKEHDQKGGGEGESGGFRPTRVALHPLSRGLPLLTSLLSRDRAYTAFRAWFESFSHRERPNQEHAWEQWRREREEDWAAAERYASSPSAPYPTGYAAFAELFLTMRERWMLTTRGHDTLIENLNVAYGRPRTLNQLADEEASGRRIGGRKARKMATYDRMDARIRARDATATVSFFAAASQAKPTLPPGPVADWHHSRPSTLTPLDPAILFSVTPAVENERTRLDKRAAHLRYPKAEDQSYIASWSKRIKACDNLRELDRLWNEVLMQIEIYPEAKETKKALLASTSAPGAGAGTAEPQQPSPEALAYSKSTPENVREFLLPSSLQGTLLAREILHYDTPSYRGSPARQALKARLPDALHRQQFLSVQGLVVTHAIYLARKWEQQEVIQEKEKHTEEQTSTETQHTQSKVSSSSSSSSSSSFPAVVSAPPPKSHSLILSFFDRQLPLVLALGAARHLILFFDYFLEQHHARASVTIMQHILYSQIHVYQKDRKTGFVIPKGSGYHVWTSKTQYEVNPEKAIFIPCTYHGFSPQHMALWYRMLRRALSEVTTRSDAVALWKIALMYEKFLIHLFPQQIVKTYRLPTVPEIEYQAWCIYSQGHVDSDPFHSFSMWRDLLSRYDGLVRHDPKHPVLLGWTDSAGPQQRNIIRGLDSTELRRTIGRMLEWASTYEEFLDQEKMEADGAEEEEVAAEQVDEGDHDQDGLNSGASSASSSSSPSSSSSSSLLITTCARSLFNHTPTPALAWLSTFIALLDVRPEKIPQLTPAKLEQFFHMARVKLVQRLEVDGDVNIVLPPSVCLAALHWCLSQHQLWRHRALTLYPAHTMECDFASHMMTLLGSLSRQLLEEVPRRLSSEVALEMQMYDINWHARRPRGAREEEVEEDADAAAESVGSSSDASSRSSSVVVSSLGRLFKTKILPLGGSSATIDPYVQYRVVTALATIMVKLSNHELRSGSVAHSTADTRGVQLLRSVTEWTTRYIKNGEAIGVLIRELHAAYAAEATAPLSPIVTEAIFALLPDPRTTEKTPTQASGADTATSSSSSGPATSILDSPRDFPLSTFSALCSLLRSTRMTRGGRSEERLQVRWIDQLDGMLEQQRVRLTRNWQTRKDLPMLKAQLQMQRKSSSGGETTQEGEQKQSNDAPATNSAPPPASAPSKAVTDTMGVFAALLEKVRRQKHQPAAAGVAQTNPPAELEEESRSAEGARAQQ